MSQFHPGLMVVVFFIYGLAWFVMGLTVALESRRTTALPLASSLKYLAAFGLLHSGAEWLDMFLLASGAPEAQGWRVTRAIFLAISTVILAYFAVHLIGRNTGGYAWLKVVPFGLFGVWLLGMVVPHLVWMPPLGPAPQVGVCIQCHRGATASYLALREAWVGSADIWARYALYLPASLLAGIGMVGQARWFRRHGYSREAKDTRVVAGAFFFNALIAGLVVPPGTYFPASVLNYATFFQAVKVPPQVLRAATALVIAFFLVRVLNVFETERRRQLERANQERLETQEKARLQLEKWTQELEETVHRRTAEVEARNRELAILEERDRIAREMHDSLGQTLSYLGLRLIGLEQLLAQGQTERARAALQEMEQAVQGAVADVRESILSLKTTLRPDRGLVATLKEYLGSFGEQTGLQTELRVEDSQELSLPHLAQAQVLRIVQEALTNVRKHAQAHRVTLSLRHQDQGLEIAVEDDGRGFDLEAVLRDRGPRFGLQTMRERAEEIGGTFQVDTTPGQGTRVLIRFPRR